MTTAQDISRAYIAAQTGHKVGSPFQIIDRPRRVSFWRVVMLGSSVAFWVLLALILWIGTGK